MLLFSLFASIAAAAPAAASKSWDLNDVSYVYSLPASVSAGVRLSEILSRDVYSQVVGQTGLTPGARTPGLVLTAEELYRNLSIVSARIDPCFRDLFTDPCQMQVRIVWQPIAALGGRYTTVDAALHTFHRLTAPQFRQLLTDLQTLKQVSRARTEGQPLDVHPGLKEKTAFALKLGALLRKNATARNLVRIAVMKLMMGENGWRFLSFNVVGGRLKLMEIFPGRIQEQQLNNLAEEGGYDARGSMATSVLREKPDQLFKVVADSRDPALSNDDALKLYFSRSIRIGQPHLHQANTVDCLSCHASDGVKAVTARALIARGFPVKLTNGSARYNFKNRSADYGSTRSMRGLGYFRDRFQVLDRTIAESAEVADTLNGRR